MPTCYFHGFWGTTGVIRVAHEHTLLLESVQISQYRDGEGTAIGAELSYDLQEGFWPSAFPSLQAHL